MSRFKIFALIALLTFALGLILVSDAVAGEKHNFRTYENLLKWETVNVGDEEGHAVILYEGRGFVSNLQGKPFCDGWVYHEMDIFDVHLKKGLVGHGYSEMTSREGDKVYLHRDHPSAKSGTLTFIKGTGRYEGIKGKGTWTNGPPTGDRNWFYTNWDGEIELPR